ncbi:hypothetical protein D8Y20_03085 [Mariprofundus sp. EBB-1]|uniref:hypothetical protein n=1 Tax=Mariprofundus sp. EBB-1 TaxID=2650971 RepID=UPI000EF24935|nr:hypothetical protein [Mariprofundus sp. EBB-1]RLL54776.1 hypothetical protein D8Y20_03085 [Mariprofundus sp. EBB-1]
MIEPVELQDFFIVFFSGAMIIMTGALYALFFAWSRLQAKPWLMSLAYISYAALFVSVLTLAAAAHLYGFWWWLVVIMLVGYLFAPHGIWKLCVGTHSTHQGDNPPIPLSSEQTPNKIAEEKGI